MQEERFVFNQLYHSLFWSSTSCTFLILLPGKDIPIMNNPTIVKHSSLKDRIIEFIQWLL